MASSETRLHWEDLDPLLTGPYAPSPGAEANAFEVPSISGRELRFGRIVSGEGWPSELAPVDRLAPVPTFPQDRVGSGSARRDIVLHFEAPGQEPLPICARRDGGPIRWNLDPAAWVQQLLSEDYVQKWARPITSRIPLFNYSRISHSLKRSFEFLQSPVSGYGSRPLEFPKVPLDSLADTLRKLCHTLCYGSAPRLADLWPDGRQAAVTLTHDVDTDWILRDAQLSLLREIVEMESRLGFTGAWYITANRLNPLRHRKALDLITEAGHEIGAHGWNHDSKLNYLGVDRQEKRMLRIAERFAGLDIQGIRTPWYCRSKQLFAVLARHFSYDSSVPNASGFFSSGSNSGCSSFFPYRPQEKLIELPMTLPPDTALHPAQGYDSLWLLADEIIEQGGVVVITLHPQPHQSANERGLARYYGFLQRLADSHGSRVWHATPRAVVRRYAQALGAERTLRQEADARQPADRPSTRSRLR